MRSDWMMRRVQYCKQCSPNKLYVFSLFISQCKILHVYAISMCVLTLQQTGVHVRYPSPLPGQCLESWPCGCGSLRYASTFSHPALTRLQSQDAQRWLRMSIHKSTGRFFGTARPTFLPLSISASPSLSFICHLESIAFLACVLVPDSSVNTLIHKIPQIDPSAMETLSCEPVRASRVRSS